MKKILLIVLTLTLIQLSAQIPSGYYDKAKGKSGNELKTALHDIIKGHTALSYDGLWNAFKTTDVKSNGKVWDMYSDKPGLTPDYEYTFGSNQCGNYNSEADCYNREHSYPKSWFNDLTPAYSDLFHLVPTDGYVNGKRSNYAFGEVGTASWTSTNGSKLGTSSFPGFSGTVFEPIDTFKGDFARNILYMSVRYYKEDSGWSSSDMTTKSEIKSWAVQLLKKWHTNDKVSAKEINRNDKVYGFQKNRNPFIDHPEYFVEIWDTLTAPSASEAKPNSLDTVIVTFDRIIDDISAKATSNYTIKGTSVSPTEAISYYKGDYYKVALVFNGLQQNNQYTLQIKGVKNKTGFSGSSTQEIAFTAPVSTFDVEPLVMTYSLEQNYPNPFNPTTSISFLLPNEQSVKVEVFNELGELVLVLADGVYSSGEHTISFSAESMKSGVYFYTMQTNDFHSVKKMILVK